MKIKQYNFIRCKSDSGKTLFTQKLVHCLGNKTVYYNLDGSSLFSETEKRGKQFTITMQNPTFGKLLRDINTFNENLYEMWNIVIDPITVFGIMKGNFPNFRLGKSTHSFRLPSQKDDFFNRGFCGMIYNKLALLRSHKPAYDLFVYVRKNFF